MQDFVHRPHRRYFAYRFLVYVIWDTGEGAWTLFRLHPGFLSFLVLCLVSPFLRAQRFGVSGFAAEGFRVEGFRVLDSTTTLGWRGRFLLRTSLPWSLPYSSHCRRNEEAMMLLVQLFYSRSPKDGNPIAPVLNSSV